MNSLTTEAASYSRRFGELGLVIYRSGELIYESYSDGFSIYSPAKLFSVTKSLWALAALAAAEDGCLSLQEKASLTLVEWLHSPREQITIKELLNMTSGMEPGEKVLYDEACADKYKAALELKNICQAGSRFTYGASGYELFAVLLQRKLQAAGSSLEEYFKERFIIPLGLGLVRWHKDRKGNIVCSSGAQMSMKDLLILAQVLLNWGRWQGRQLIREELLKESLCGSAANPAYGMGFWLNSRCAVPEAEEVDIENALAHRGIFQDWSTACLSLAVPADTFAMLGSGGQRLYVMPSAQTVIVRLGTKASFKDAEFLSRL